MSFQAWLTRFESQGDAKKGRRPRGHCAAVYTRRWCTFMRVRVRVYTESILLSFFHQEPWPCWCGHLTTNSLHSRSQVVTQDVGLKCQEEVDRGCWRLADHSVPDILYAESQTLLFSGAGQREPCLGSQWSESPTGGPSGLGAGGSESGTGCATNSLGDLRFPHPYKKGAWAASWAVRRVLGV